MANTDSAFGFKPVGHLLGLPWTNRGRWYYVPATDGTAIGMYDYVIGVATGAESTGKFRYCAQATAGSVQKLGPALAFQTNTPESDVTSLAAATSDTRLAYRPASTACYVFVQDDPWIICEVQEDSDTSTLAAADVGLNANLIVAAANATTGLSGMELDSNTANTTNTLDFRILSLSGTNTDRNNAIGTNAKWLVIANTHAYKGLVGL